MIDIWVHGKTMLLSLNSSLSRKLQREGAESYYTVIDKFGWSCLYGDQGSGNEMCFRS